MKIFVLIARTLLGVSFLFFGLNGFFGWLKGEQPGVAGEFIHAMNVSHYILFLCAIYIVAGILLLINRYPVLGLTLLGPVIVNILAFHIFMAPATILPGLIVTALWCVVAFYYRRHFAGLFVQRG